MIENCDKFKALVHVVHETNFTTEGRWNDPNFYLFIYGKLSKTICIYSIQVHKDKDKNGKLSVWTDWKTKTYTEEKPALRALTKCIKDIKVFNNLYRVTQANEDF